MQADLTHLRLRGQASNKILAIPLLVRSYRLFHGIFQWASFHEKTHGIDATRRKENIWNMKIPRWSSSRKTNGSLRGDKITMYIIVLFQLPWIPSPSSISASRWSNLATDPFPFQFHLFYPSARQPRSDLPGPIYLLFEIFRYIGAR